MHSQDTINHIAGIVRVCDIQYRDWHVVQSKRTANGVDVELVDIEPWNTIRNAARALDFQDEIRFVEQYVKSQSRRGDFTHDRHVGARIEKEFLILKTSRAIGHVD